MSGFATPPPIDPASIANLRAIGGDDAGFVAELVQLFREDTPPQLDELARCASSGDAGRLAGSKQVCPFVHAV